MKKIIAIAVIIIQSAIAQQQLWFQQPSGRIGPVMSLHRSPLGSIYASVYNKGLFRSRDNGVTWEQTAPHMPGVWSLGIASNGIIFASLWSYGIYQSTDDGDSWSKVAGSKMFADIRFINKDNTLFLEAEGNLFRSTDNGSSWTSGMIGAGIVIANGDTMFAAKGDRVYSSTDNGIQWHAHSTVPSPIYSMNFSGDGTLMIGTYADHDADGASVYRYHATSKTWIANGSLSTINALVSDQIDIIFAASHDSGFYCSTNNGITWRTINEGLSTKKILSMITMGDSLIMTGTPDGIFYTKNLRAVLSAEGVHDRKANVMSIELMQNYPNPFNPSTTIYYRVGTTNHVTLRVTDLLGSEIALLVDEIKSPGMHSVQMVTNQLSSGTYIYTLHMERISVSRKMLLLR